MGEAAKRTSGGVELQACTDRRIQATGPTLTLLSADVEARPAGPVGRALIVRRRAVTSPGANERATATASNLGRPASRRPGVELQRETILLPPVAIGSVGVMTSLGTNQRTGSRISSLEAAAPLILLRANH